MLRASKCPPCATSTKIKRNKCVWHTIDTGDLTVDEYDAARTDNTFHSIKSGKCYGQCKYHSRFPDCNLRTRKYNLVDGTKTIEETGHHNHGVETFVTGLSQRYKDEIVSLLILNNKFKPTIIRIILENKFNVTLNEKERNQTCGFIARKSLLLRDVWECNAISGVTAFANKNQWHKGLDDDDACVANFDV